MKRRAKEKLPPIPVGNELLDLVWRDMTPEADVILAGLPLQADEAWATTAGIRAFWDAVIQQFGAIEELERTPVESTLLLTRQRETRRLQNRSVSCAKCIAAALRQRIHAEWPAATPE